MEPIKVELGSISTPESLKSKSTLVIPIPHKSSSPQKGTTWIALFCIAICGKVSKSLTSILVCMV